MKSLYLLIDLCSISIPLLFSFHPRIKLYREWRGIIASICAVLVVFVPWDIAFTARGIWGFNPRYLLGVYIYRLPIEEILFFICIPYACLFTYYVLQKTLTPKDSPLTSTLLLTLLSILALFSLGRAYTLSATLAALATLLLARGGPLRMPLAPFYRIYAILLIPFFIVNGLLTGTAIPEEVVWYNNQENTQIRLGTIPADDTIYGFAMILLTVLVFEKMRRVPAYTST